MSNRVLVYGGKGALGSSLVTFFKQKGWITISIDFHKNDSADHNICLSDKSTWSEQAEIINKQLSEILGSNKLDAILNVAGGWAGGNAASKKLLANSEAMWKASVQSSILSGQLASKYLKEDGLLVLTGAASALTATPSAIGYGVAKAAVHHLVKSFAADGSGLPKGVVVAGIAPEIIDTEMNRKWMPKADFSNWTKLQELVDLLYGWSIGKDRPESGTILKIKTTKGNTTFEKH